MHRPGRLLVGALLCVGLTVGCGNAVGGTPVPAGVSSSARDGSAESARPREVRLDGVDPCSLLTQQQRQVLGIDRPPYPSEGESFEGAVGCDFGNTAEESGYLVLPVTTQGLAEYVATAESQLPVRPLEIAGFPAVEIRKPPDAGGNLFCLIGVDVADGQFLLGSFGQVAPSGPALSVDTLCAEAVQHTTAAMTTLLNQR